MTHEALPSAQDYEFATVLRESRLRRERRDCTVKALALATDYTYDDAHYALSLAGRRRHRGARTNIVKKAAQLLRFDMVDVTSQFSARTIRTLEREMKWHSGRYIVRVQGHMLAVVDGKVYDKVTKGRLHRVCEVYKMVETDPEFHERNMTCEYERGIRRQLT
jgi:hypothetical protein